MDWKPRIAAYFPGDIRQNVLGPIVDTFGINDSTFIVSGISTLIREPRLIAVLGQAYGALAGVIICDRQLQYLETLRIQDAFPSRNQDTPWAIDGVRCTSNLTGTKVSVLCWRLFANTHLNSMRRSWPGAENMRCCGRRRRKKQGTTGAYGVVWYLNRISHGWSTEKVSMLERFGDVDPPLTWACQIIW